jgi:hypothetical protein
MEGEEEPEDELNLLPWLWTNYVKLILEKLGKCGQPEAILPQIWLIGTGIASSLPFHAAGEYSFSWNSLNNFINHMRPWIPSRGFQFPIILIYKHPLPSKMT